MGSGLNNSIADNNIAASSVLSDFQGEQRVNNIFKTKINAKQFLQDAKYTNTKFYQSSNLNYNITFLNDAPEVLKLNNINIDETKKITNNYPYLSRLKNTGIPVLSNIILSLIKDTTGNTVFKPISTEAYILTSRIRIDLGALMYHFGVNPPTASGSTTITPQNLDIDITIEAVL